MRPSPTLLLVASLVLSGCARQVTLPTPVRSETSPRVKACPLGVPTSKLDVTDTAAGADVLLTADDAYVRELRARASTQARVNGPGWKAGPGHFGVHGIDHDHGLRLWKLGTSVPGMEVAYEEVAGGAVLHVTTKEAAHVEQLRGHLKSRVAHLDLQSCEY